MRRASERLGSHRAQGLHASRLRCAARRAPAPAPAPLRYLTRVAAPRSKTRGLGAGRKLKTRRREQRWHDKGYCRAHLGSEWKKPFAGTSHSKGIVLEKMCVPAPPAAPAGPAGAPGP